jgi:uncharacterized membrane protein YkoI
MRWRIIFGACAALAAWTVYGAAVAQTDCLNAEEARDLVERRVAMSPSRALRAARTSYPDHDVLRALLCRSQNGYVYVVTVLSRDGRVTRAIINADSGRTIRQ